MHRVLVELHKCHLTYEAYCDSAHVNLVVDHAATLKTRTVTCVRRELLFRTEDKNERFLTLISDSKPTIEFQLRRDRFLLPSVRIASAIISLADFAVGVGQSFESVEMLNREGRAVAHLGVDIIVVPNPGESLTSPEKVDDTVVDENHDLKGEDHQRSVLQAPVDVLAMSTASPPVPPKPAPEARPMRSRGSQTDAVPVWPADVGTNVSSPAVEHHADHDPAADHMPSTLAISAGAEFPIAAAETSPELIGDVGLRMRKRTAIAWPTDEMEGLVLYCELLQEEKRAAENRLAQYHITKALGRARSIREPSPQSRSAFVVEMSRKHGLNSQDAALVAQAFADI